MYLLPTTLFCFLLLSSTTVKAGTQTEGQSCDVNNNRLQIGTYQFWSDCDSQTYCTARGTCAKRGCRQDDFPFGYAPDDELPRKCPRGEFCPDEMSECQVLLPVGSECQLNRDDQCEAPPNFPELADDSDRGINFNGSVCLKNICMWANVTEGDTCIVENTFYIAYSADGEFPDIRSRGNCRLGLYCDGTSLKCLKEKAIGDSCTADKECASWNCEPSGKCGIGADVPRRLAIWVYIVVGICIFGGMFGTLVGLFFWHSKQRDADREKRVQYWREQNAFHQNLMQMRETARASIISPNQNGISSARSTIYSRDGALSDESQAPIMQNAAPKASSGLRNYLTEDNSSDYEDGMMMQTTDRKNRF
ncbi:hypothetical protein CCMSSC00406_0002596 [Pleurotus cornucopiae]|uniref:Uncharacterized protein n=1 Tax=Pleurotus cornucopiae TaxID=5321 RepID=A0ACB7ISP9_PLECO|nr:hypothetical protein CCMSSC00406_0002596 [Pleurotus cornucopiae]